MAHNPPEPTPVEIPNCLGQSTLGSERIAGVMVIWYGPVANSLCSGILSSERIQGSATVSQVHGQCAAKAWVSRQGRRVDRHVELDRKPDVFAAQQILRDMYSELLDDVRRPTEPPPEVVAELGGHEINGVPHGYWVGWDPKKEVVWRGHYMEGKWHGRWVGSDLDGNVRYYQTYDNGKLHGPYQGRTPDEEREQGQYVDGLHDGVWTVWGIGDPEWKSSQRSYKLGKLHGRYQQWRPDGGLWISCDYREGAKHGTETVYSHDGTVRLKVEYEDGKVVGARGPAFERLPDHMRDEILSRAEDG